MNRHKNKFWETVKSVGLALLVALSLRAFLVEPFKIPSPSMVPTLLVGDQIFANKFVYGLRVPFTKKRFWNGRDPGRGEIILFKYPVDESLDFIKRVVGLPGDTVRIEGEDVYVNGEKLHKEDVNLEPFPNNPGRATVTPPVPYKTVTLFPEWAHYRFYQEELGPVKHLVQEDSPWFPSGEFKVPEGNFFVMGDNRDHSADSREWGFVPRENIIGRAMFIWLSFDWDKPLYDLIRWHRFGRWIY